MKVSRRSFFGFLGGAAVATVVAPKAIIYKSRSVGITTATEAEIAKAVAGGNSFITPEIYANEFLKLLKKNMVMGRMVNGQND